MKINAPRYVSPKERAENRARWLRFAYGVVVAIPVLVALMMVGYSDQAPAWLRAFTLALDGALGQSVLWLIQKLMA
ncbi:MAG: hypothetical protein ACK4UO_01995 [Pseudolabrys sp.]